jgi:hypothetical protein
MSYEAALPATSFRGRRTKLTPERIEQIKELIKSGVSCEEIASLVGVTTGTLKVSCSRLGISLRRPRPKNGNCWPLSKAAVFTRMSTFCGAKFAVIVHYHGEERATELPLTTAMIRRLAFEAASRGLTISELAGGLVANVATRGLVHRVLDE